MGSMMKFAIALGFAFVCASGAAAAQETRGAATVTPTAGIDSPPRDMESLKFQRTPRQDSVMSGGALGNLPTWTGTLPSPCEINPDLAGCTPTDPSGGGSTGGGGGTTDPCVATPTLPECGGGGGGGGGSGGGGGLPLAPTFDNLYAASSSYTHDTGATLALVIAADGSCTVTTTALKTPMFNKTYNCGNVVPSGADPADYEVSFTPNVTVVDTVPPPASKATYTAATAWLALSGAPKASADTGHIIGGGAGDGYRSVEGTYSVKVRSKSSGDVVEAVMQFAIDAECVN